MPTCVLLSLRPSHEVVQRNQTVIVLVHLGEGELKFYCVH